MGSLGVGRSKKGLVYHNTNERTSCLELKSEEEPTVIIPIGAQDMNNIHKRMRLVHLSLHVGSRQSISPAL